MGVSIFRSSDAKASSARSRNESMERLDLTRSRKISPIKMLRHPMEKRTKDPISLWFNGKLVGERYPLTSIALARERRLQSYFRERGSSDQIVWRATLDMLRWCVLTHLNANIIPSSDRIKTTVWAMIKSRFNTAQNTPAG
jgi:hypothetical protein